MVLLNLVEKTAIFTSKWTMAWHHGVKDASLNAHLQSFDAERENVGGQAAQRHGIAMALQ